MPSFNIPTPNGTLTLNVEGGQSAVFLGANGGGKTRLGVHLEQTSPTPDIHRIGAQRALQFSPNIALVDSDTAESLLRYGLDPRNNMHIERGQRSQYKFGHRWGSRPATQPLSDYDLVLQALFADQLRDAVDFLRAAQEGRTLPTPVTRLHQLAGIWHDLLPHRQLRIGDATIKVMPRDAVGTEYDAIELSDGERVILYLIGQCLLMPRAGVLIIDEPELHINRAIMAKLWDALESARPDCAFIYITHDLEFAASRSGAQKFALRDYFGAPSQHWDIEPLPADEAFPEEVVCRIVGSRQPVLFVEGENGSFDSSLYRRIYSSHNVIAVGGCEAVIGGVAAFKANTGLHRVACCGIVDADDRSEEDIANLRKMGVLVTPVSEVENLFLLPDVFSALGQTLGHDASAADGLANQLSGKIAAIAVADEASFALRYVKRRIDRSLKKLGLKAKDLTSLSSEVSGVLNSIDPTETYNAISARLRTLITDKNIAGLLAIYDNKGMLNEAAKLLSMSRKGLEEHIGRMLRAPQGQAFLEALKSHLPELPSVKSSPLEAEETSTEEEPPVSQPQSAA